MKSEEIDRLFRDELEKLEASPDMEWSDEAAWKKIETKLQGGWSNLLIGSIIVVVLAGIYMLSTSLLIKETAVIPKQNLLLSDAPLVKDTVKKVKAKKILPSKKKINKIKELPTSSITVDLPAAIVVVSKDTFAEASLDTSKSNFSKRRVNFHSQQYTNRYSIFNFPTKQKEFRFYMPEYSVFRMEVTNSYNFANLLKSIAAERSKGDNFYYIYEYNKVPAPTDMNHFPVAMPDNRQIITNFSR